MTSIKTQTQLTLEPEEKQKRIDRLMDCTKEEIATQWVTVGTNMKEEYDKLKMEFIKYRIANDISRFFEDVRSEQSDEILGSKFRDTIRGNILYVNWLKKNSSNPKSKKNKK